VGDRERTILDFRRVTSTGGNYLGGSAFLAPQPTNLYTSIYIVIIKCRLDKEFVAIHHELQLQVMISANLEETVNKQL
jgi:hypothetical protein